MFSSQTETTNIGKTPPSTSPTLNWDDLANSMKIIVILIIGNTDHSIEVRT